jgi:hypothetical protein
MQMCTAIWENADQLQNAGESAQLEPATALSTSPPTGQKRHLLAAPGPGMGAAEEVLCDGRTQA